MAVNSSSYFNNAIVGQTQVGAGVNLYASSTSPAFALGTKFERSDGNVYRYGHFGLTTPAGSMVATDISETCIADTDNAIIAPASAVAVQGETMQPGDIGSHYVQMTVAAITADQLAGGYLHTTDDTGEGYCYRIKGNTATDVVATGDIRIQLWDRIQVALDATTDAIVTGSRWSNLEPATTTDVFAAGVAMTAQATADYGWIQTAGIATVLTAGVVVLGSGCILTATAGAVGPAVETDILERVGVCYIVGDDTGYSSIKLTLD